MTTTIDAADYIFDSVFTVKNACHYLCNIKRIDHTITNRIFGAVTPFGNLNVVSFLCSFVLLENYKFETEKIFEEC